MGAAVLHDEAVFPVRRAAIPVNIRNTRAPEDPGTLIVDDAGPAGAARRVTGLAGRRDFTVITVEKALMNAQIGFGRRVLSAFEVHGVSLEHIPSGIDTLSVVVADGQIEGKLEAVLADIRAECDPDAIDVMPTMALIAVVGQGMSRTPGIAAGVFSALADAGVNIRMIDQGSSELNIIIGVETEDYETATRAIYRRMIAGQ
jgi:aspartate kinase